MSTSMHFKYSRIEVDLSTNIYAHEAEMHGGEVFAGMLVKNAAEP